MVKVYGNPGSTCTRKVLCALGELGVNFEMNVIDFMKSEHKTPAHMTRQPFGQVPTIDDNGFSLYESRAICRYLNEKFSGKLVPGDVQSRALMEQWISVETSNFTPNAMKLVYNYVFYPMWGKGTDQEMINAGNSGLETSLTVMNTWLAKNDYFAGKEFSIADISYMPYVEYLMPTPAKEIFAKYPAVMAWWTRCSERASWRKVTGR